MLKQLIEQARDLYDWIALLWAASGEAPAKDLLANVDYRRAPSSISDCKNLFWTRVSQNGNPSWYPYCDQTNREPGMPNWKSLLESRLQSFPFRVGVEP